MDKTEGTIIREICEKNGVTSAYGLATLLSTKPRCKVTRATTAKWVSDQFKPSDEQLIAMKEEFAGEWPEEIAVALLASRRDHYADLVEASRASENLAPSSPPSCG